VVAARLVEVLETTPYVLTDASGGAVAANAGAETKRNAANPTLAKRPRPIIRLKIFFAYNILTPPFHFPSNLFS
jgi:hypothetical protein